MKAYCRGNVMRPSVNESLLRMSLSPPTLDICNRALFSIIQSNESKQRDGWSLAYEILAAAVSSCFLNGSSIEFHEKKNQPFTEFICCSIFKLGDSNFSVERLKMRFSPLFCTYNSKCNSQRKTHQIAHFRHFEPAADRNGNTKQYATTEVGALR